MSPRTRQAVLLTALLIHPAAVLYATAWAVTHGGWVRIASILLAAWSLFWIVWVLRAVHRAGDTRSNAL